jgi:hypothetical protein
MQPRFPIYIPSKSRAENGTTARVLDEMNVPYKIVVEEQQFAEYNQYFSDDKLLILDPEYLKNYDTFDDLGDTKSKGPGAARNFIWDHSISQGHSWHWVIDDNISLFARLHKNQRIPVGDGTIFHAMEEFVLRYKNIAMAGPQYWMFAPSRAKLPPFVVGTRIYSCNLIRNDVPFRWRGRYNEDTDLSLRMLKNNWQTVQFNAFLQYKLTTQTLTGGNTEAFYAEEGTLPKSQMLVKMHPDVTKLVQRFNRWHHHVNYGPFKNIPLLKDADAKIVDSEIYKMKLVPAKKHTNVVTVKNEPTVSEDHLEPFTVAYQNNLENLQNLPEPTYPIYVPSKGRASTILTTKCLIEAKVENFYVVVEPQDQDSYEKQFNKANILVMPENNKGIAYVRNFCKEHAKTKGFSYHWQIDDNIQSFAIRQNQQNQKCLISDAIKLIESTVNQFTGIGAAGMKHQVFAWSEKNDIGYNRQVYTSMLLSTEPEVIFRDGLIEDADYNLQILFDCYSVVLFNRVVMNKITSMKMQGGNTEISHANGGREKRAIATQAQWPNIFKLKESKDGPRLAPSRVWSTFQQRPVPKVF